MFDIGLEHPAVFTSAAGFLLVFMFYVLGWWLTGRDPAAADCDDQITPPDNLSPAAQRYVRRMAADTRAAAAALMSLAERGHVVMDWENGRVRLRKAEAPDTNLPAAEAALAHDLLYTRSTLVLQNTVSNVIAPALKRFRRKLGREHGRAVFRSNRGWLIAGLGLSVLILGTATAQSNAPLAFMVLSALAIASVVGLTALMQVLLPARYIFPEPLSRGLRAAVRRAVEAGFIVVASPLAFVALADMIADPPVPLSAIAFAAALAGLHLVVYHLIKAPTVPGSSTRRRIEKFRSALSSGEVRPASLPVAGGIYAFALDLPEEAGNWSARPGWLRQVAPGTQPPEGYQELGEALTEALDAASMPPARALFGETPQEDRPAPPEAA